MAKRRYSVHFRQVAVERLRGCENIVALAKVEGPATSSGSQSRSRSTRLVALHGRTDRLPAPGTRLEIRLPGFAAEKRNAASQLGNDGFFPGPQFSDIDARAGKGDSAVLRLAGGRDGMGSVQQRL